MNKHQPIIWGLAPQISESPIRQQAAHFSFASLRSSVATAQYALTIVAIQLTIAQISKCVHLPFGNLLWPRQASYFWPPFCPILGSGDNHLILSPCQAIKEKGNSLNLTRFLWDLHYIFRNDKRQEFSTVRIAVIHPIDS